MALIFETEKYISRRDNKTVVIKLNIPIYDSFGTEYCVYRSMNPYFLSKYSDFAVIAACAFHEHFKKMEEQHND